MPDYTDKPRLLQFKADGKTDLLLPASFSAQERISGLFQIHVELVVSPEKASQIKGDQLLGKRMTLKVAHGDDYTKPPYRFFDGVCCRFASAGKNDRFHLFEADLVPWAWMLTKRVDTRVFQDKNSLDIVEVILKELQGDFSEFKFEIRANRGQYKKVDYRVQFAESQFHFVSRLLEEEGIYYYFEHTDAGHKMIIDDSPTAGGDVPDQAKVRLMEESGPGETYEDCVVVWREERTIHPGKFSSRDYHMQLAQNKIEFSGVAPKTIVGKNDKLEVYEWQSGSALRYNQPDKRLDEVNTVGDKLTNYRAQEAEAGHHTFTGTSYCRGFVPGYRFSLEHDSGTKYLLTEVRHSAVQNPNYVTGVLASAPHSNTFVAIPATVQFRPQSVTEKPVVEGLQSAKVVGKKGDEIYVDKYGRVRVQFFWDRKGENDEKSTCWVRVAQISAGKRWGSSFFPRIGQEVAVAFMEGDPDQPVIVGSLYNNQQMPPYLGEGRDDKHKHDPNISGIKTNSTKGGDGFNELRFDDTKDKEQVFIHAERDMDVRVKREMREQNLAERHIIVGDEEADAEKSILFQKVFGAWNLHTLRRKLEKVEGDHFHTIGLGEEDGGNYHLYVEKDRKEQVGGNRHLTVDGDRIEKVGGKHSMTLGSWDTKVEQTAAVEVTQSLHLKAMTMVLEADLQLTLKVGGNFIDISPAGVAINGMPMVLINSGGAPGVGLGAHPQSPEAPDKGEKGKPPADWFHKADSSKTGDKSCD